MSKPGKLNDILGDIETAPDNPQLDWEHAGPAIQKALQDKERRRRRLLIWWLSGLGLSLIAAFLFFQTNEVTSKKSASIQLGSELSNTNTASKSQDLSQPSSIRTPNQLTEKKGSLLTNDRSTSRETSIDTYIEESLIMTNEESISAATEKNLTDILNSVEPNFQANVDDSTRPDLAGSTSENQNSKPEGLQGRRSDIKPWKFTPRLGLIDSLSKISFLDLNLLDLPTTELFAISTVSAVKKKPRATKSIYLLAGSGTHNLDDVLDFSESPASGVVELGMVFVPFQNPALSNIEFSAGIQYSTDRITTAFTNSSPVQLYRPGTVDTIISYSIGEETRITRDSVPGIATRVFRNTASFDQWSVPFHVGYGFSAGIVRLTPEAGIMPTLIQQRSGRISDANFLITDIQQNSSVDLQLAYRLGLRVGVPVGKGQVLMRYVFSHTLGFRVSTDINRPLNRQTLQLGFQYPF